MKAVLGAALFALSGAGITYGALGDVVNSFAAPASYPIALARATSDQEMWVFCYDGLYPIYQINAETGSILHTYPNAIGGWTRGLTYESPGYLYIGGMYPHEIRKVPSNNINSVIFSYDAGHEMSGGLAIRATGDGGVGGSELWSSRSTPSYVWTRTRSTGSILSSFAGHATAVGDLAWDWRNNILWSGGSPSTIYGYNAAGSIVASFPSPAQNPAGMTYFNSYLWIGTGEPTHRIWKVHCPGTVSTAPSSLGRVKALLK